MATVRKRFVKTDICQFLNTPSLFRQNATGLYHKNHQVSVKKKLAVILGMTGGWDKSPLSENFFCKIDESTKIPILEKAKK
jgi:hypothetical protein